MSDIQIREYIENDVEQICDLFRRTFGKPMSEANEKLFFKWKYLDNPAGKVKMIVAEDKDQIIRSVYSAIPRIVNIKGEERCATISVDSMTDPSCGGKGLFTKTGRAFYEWQSTQNIPITYGFPNGNSHHLFVSKLGWDDIGVLSILINPLNYERIIRSKFNISFFASIVGMLTKDFVRRRIEKYASIVNRSSYRIEIVEKWDERSDFLWDTLKNSFQIIAVRNRDYLNWRFVFKPNESYKKFLIMGGGKGKENSVIGYAVIKQEERFGIRIGYIADVMVENNNDEASDALLSEIMLYAYQNKLDLLSCLMLPHCHFYSVLKRNFFFNLPERFFPKELYFGARINDKSYDKEFVTNEKNWYLTWADLDVI